MKKFFVMILSHAVLFSSCVSGSISSKKDDSKYNYEELGSVEEKRLVILPLHTYDENIYKVKLEKRMKEKAIKKFGEDIVLGTITFAGDWEPFSSVLWYFSMFGHNEIVNAYANVYKAFKKSQTELELYAQEQKQAEQEQKQDLLDRREIDKGVSNIKYYYDNEYSSFMNITLNYENLSEKPLKYIIITLGAKNEVDDYIDPVGGDAKCNLKIMKIEPRYKGKATFESVYWMKTRQKVFFTIEKVTYIYFDGTEEEF